MLSILKCIKNSFTDYTVLCLLFTQCIHTLIYLLFLFYFLCYSYVFYCTFYWKHNCINIWPKILFVFGYFEKQTWLDKTFHLYLIEMSLSTVMNTIFMVCRQTVTTVLRKKTVVQDGDRQIGLYSYFVMYFCRGFLSEIWFDCFQCNQW